LARKDQEPEAKSAPAKDMEEGAGGDNLPASAMSVGKDMSLMASCEGANVTVAEGCIASLQVCGHATGRVQENTTSYLQLLTSLSPLLLFQYGTASVIVLKFVQVWRKGETMWVYSPHL